MPTCPYCGYENVEFIAANDEHGAVYKCRRKKCKHLFIVDVYDG